MSHYNLNPMTERPLPSTAPGSARTWGGWPVDVEELFISISPLWARDIFPDPLDMPDRLCYTISISPWGFLVGGTKKVSEALVAEAVRLYESELLNFREIGERLGVSRQVAYIWVREYGGCTMRALSIEAKCAHCGEPYRATRQRIKAGRKYCSRSCYFFATSKFGDYSEAAQLQGRKAAGAMEGEVVHHIDGCTFNSAPGNLIVFSSHTRYRAFIECGAAAWLKDRVARGKVKLTEVTRWPDGENW